MGWSHSNLIPASSQLVAGMQPEPLEAPSLARAGGNISRLRGTKAQGPRT